MTLTKQDKGCELNQKIQKHKKDFDFMPQTLCCHHGFAVTVFCLSMAEGNVPRQRKGRAACMGV